MASLVQAAKTLPNGYSAQDLIHRVRMSAHKSLAPDSLVGYGIPNFATVLNGLGVEPLQDLKPWTLHLAPNGWTLRRIASGTADVLEFFSVDGRVLERIEVAPGQTEVPLRGRPFWGYVRSASQVLPVAARH